MRNGLADVERGDWVAYVKLVREATGLKTGALAARAAVSPETWWRWEKGRQKPREIEVVQRFAQGFGLPVEHVMWAAGLVVEQPQPNPDPRLRGLDPEDPVVRHILSLEIDEETRGFMLNRRREILALRREQDLRELDIIIRRERGAA